MKLIFSTMCLLSLSMWSASTMTHADGTYHLIVHLKDVKAEQGGMIRCSLFKNESGFPSEYKQAIERQSIKPKPQSICRFRVTEPGVYAVAVLHDQNENGRMDTNMVGAPKEGWAVSKNTKPLFRAPRFSESKINIIQTRTTLRVAMRY